MPRLMDENDWSEIWNKRIIKAIDIVFRFNMWRSYKKFLKEIGLCSESRVLELGCGTGKNSLKIYKDYNCKITLVDNCKAIIKKSKEMFKKNNVNAKFILKDIFTLKLNKKYNLVFSEGLIEHFSGKERKKIFKIHKKFVKRNGYILILVPHSSKLYWFIRNLSEKIRLWAYIEMPSTKKELISFCKENNLTPIKFLKPFLGLWIGVLAQAKK